MLEPAIRDLAARQELRIALVAAAERADRQPRDVGRRRRRARADQHRGAPRQVQGDGEPTRNVTVTIWQLDDPYTYAEVRGVVTETVRGPEARAHIDALSQKYSGTPYTSEIKSERVIVKITPERQIRRKV